MIGITSPLVTIDRLLDELPSEPLRTIGTVVLGWYLLVLVHELGHVAGGLATGMRFHWMSVGPVRLARTGNRWTLQVEKMHWQGGFAALDPVSTDSMRWRHLVMIFGGLAANLVFGVLVLGIASFVPEPARLAINPLESLAAFSIGLGLASLFPEESATFVPDGNRIAMLLANNAKATRHLATLKLKVAMAVGQRFRNWDPETVQAALSLEDGSLDEVAAKGLCYAFECDRENVPGAACLLERLLELTSIMPSMRDYLITEAAFFQAWYKRDRSKASSWWELGGKNVKKLPSCSRLRAEVGMRYVEGDYQAAMEKIEEGLAEIRKMPESPQRSVTEQNWLEWKEKLLARQREAQKSAHFATAT